MTTLSCKQSVSFSRGMLGIPIQNSSVTNLSTEKKNSFRLLTLLPSNHGWHRGQWSPKGEAIQTCKSPKHRTQVHLGQGVQHILNLLTHRRLRILWNSSLRDNQYLGSRTSQTRCSVATIFPVRNHGDGNHGRRMKW